MCQDAPYHCDYILFLVTNGRKWVSHSCNPLLPVVTPSTCYNSAWSKDWSKDSQSSHERLPNRFQNLTWSIANSAATVSTITHVSAWLLGATENQVMAILQVETYLPKSQCRSLLCRGSFHGHEKNPSNFVTAILYLQFWILRLKNGPSNVKAPGSIKVSGSPYVNQ